jgi:hypothetical protein
MPAEKKEPMIARSSRPSAIDYDAPVSDFKLRDLVALVNSQMLEFVKYTPQPEQLKPEQYKPERYKPEMLKPEHVKPEKEHFKPEKEQIKPEKELVKAEKELIKPEKEMLKPEKERMKPELSKPEKEFEIPDDFEPFVDRIATRVVEMLKQQGLGR